MDTLIGRNSKTEMFGVVVEIFNLFTREVLGEIKLNLSKSDSVQNNHSKTDCWAEEQSVAFVTVSSWAATSNPTRR